MRNIIKPNKNLEVKKSENLVTARYSLNPLAIKFLTTVIAGLKRDDDFNKEYIFKIKDFQELTGQKTKRMKQLIEEAIKNLIKNPLKIYIDEKKDDFFIAHWISGATVENGEVKFMIYPRLQPYLIEAKEKFLKYKLENILNLRSSYSIRLYEILKDNFNQNNRYHKTAELRFKVDKLREKLEIPNSYTYFLLKKRILEKAKKELKENTDIFFEYEVIKKGRKVDEIKFTIFKNSDKVEIEKPTIIQKKVIKKKTVSKKSNKIYDNWNEWRKELIKKGNLIIFLEDEIFKVKNRYLFQNDKLLSKEKSLEIWQNLFKNIDELKIMDEDEYIQGQIKKAEEQNNIFIKIKELREKYDNKTIFGQPNKQNLASEFRVNAIQFYKDDEKEIALYLEENFTKESSITLFKDINSLEQFLKSSYENNLNKNKNDILINKVKKLKNKYTNSQLLIEISDNENIEAKVLDIKFNENSVNLYLKIDDEESIEPFELNDNEINRLENFLKVCNKAYLKTQKKDIKSKLSSIIKRF